MKYLNQLIFVGFVSMLIVACGGDSAPSSEAEEETATTSTAPAGQPIQSMLETSSSADGRPRLVAAVRGLAEIGYLAPQSRREGNENVTVFEVKNLATGAIAGLKIDEFWYDNDGNTVTGDSQRVRRPLLQDEEITIELRVPIQPQMVRSNYQFSHQNGDIQATELAEFISPEGEAEEAESASE